MAGADDDAVDLGALPPGARPPSRRRKEPEPDFSEQVLGGEKGGTGSSAIDWNEVKSESDVEKAASLDETTAHVPGAIDESSAVNLGDMPAKSKTSPGSGGSSTSQPLGTLGAACYADNRCNAELTCVANKCITTGPGGHGLRIRAPANLNPSSPAFKAAQAKCTKFVQNVAREIRHAAGMPERSVPK